MHDVLDIRDLLGDELDQQAESGHDVEPYRTPVATALREAVDEAVLEELLAAVEGAPLRADWPYDEPDDATSLATLARDAGAAVAPWGGDDAALEDRLHGAWLGRCVGCTLGKPFEKVRREDIDRYLRAAGVEQLEDYAPLLDPAPHGIELHESWPETVRGRVDGVARDDDTDYTILGLYLLETHGPGFTRADVAKEWLRRFPFLQIYTAERAAYRNLVQGHPPDLAGRIRNPYREWIGAQIRADAWGYASPGDVTSAARMAYEDAGLSHAGNGVYGELWAAALVSAAFTAEDPAGALAVAARVVPPRSRLGVALAEVVAAHAAGTSWSTWRDALDERPWGAYSWVHTVNNACVVAGALLWGDGAFTRSVSLAVQGGWDTDCNGATVGSVLGAMYGRDAIADRWTEPLRDEVRSALFGFERSSIADLAGRTAEAARRARAAGGRPWDA